MIQIINFLLRAIVTIFILMPIAILAVSASFIMWDIEYVDKTWILFEYLWFES